MITSEAIFVTRLGALYALDPETGSVQWVRPEEGIIGPVAALTDDTVYTGLYDVTAVNRRTGALKWRYGGISSRGTNLLRGMRGMNLRHVEVTRNSLISTPLVTLTGGVLQVFDLAKIDQLLAEGKTWWTVTVDWQFYQYNARSFRESGMLHQAIATYKEAIKSAPELEVPWLYAELGEVYYEQGNLEAAEAAYAKTGLPRETDWLVIGPFDNTDDKGRTNPYPPETEIDLSAAYEGKAGTVQWQEADDGRMDGRLNFTKIFTPSEWVVAYALIDALSPDDREAQLRIGSDDGVKVWLNGQVVWTKQVPRGLRLDEDVVPITLKKGANRLLFKVDQGTGAWEFTFRITDTSGQPIEGLRFRSAERK